MFTRYPSRIPVFSIRDIGQDQNCQGYSRRDFLRVGGLSLGGLSLPWLLSQGASAANAGSNPLLKDRAVVLLFLQGGPPHIETFDPHMEATANIRSATGEVKTSLPGVTFGSSFPRLAKMAHKISVVRSFGSKNSGHTYEKVASGNNPLKASMGSIYSRVAGANDAVTGLPNNTLILPEAVKDGLKLQGNFESQAMPSLTAPGSLGVIHDAFNPSGGGDLKKDMEMRVARERFTDRRGILGKLDGMRRRLDPAMEGADIYQQQAFDVITKGIADAFDLKGEDERTLARYDTTGLFRMEEWTKFHNMKRTSNLLGHQMLMARRLVENGCGFVTVSDCGWDLHADGNSAPGLTAMEPLGGQVDHAVASFIEDVEARGLSDKVLLVVTGEMGRSPKINNRGGRDHYGELTPLLVYGGGLKMGQVIGRSDQQAARPETRGYTPENLLATVMHSIFNVSELRLRTDLPSGFSRDFGLRSDHGAGVGSWMRFKRRPSSIVDESIFHPKPRCSCRNTWQHGACSPALPGKIDCVYRIATL